jgi:precorrin-2/cobalt-factor-2 C20-methyltransferase
MAVNQKSIAIVGCGPGSARYVTDAARQAVNRADVLVGSRRLLDLFPDCAAERIAVDADIPLLLERIAALRDAGRRVSVLVSGDPGLYSLAQNVVRRFGREHCEITPAVSSVQVAFARLGLDSTDARILSAHGRTPEIAADQLRRSDKIAILAGGRDALQWSARMAESLDADHVAFLAENLTLDDERFRQISPKQLAAIDAASLSIVLLIRSTLLGDCPNFRVSENGTVPLGPRQATLYGIGVGPGDPQWITVKAVNVLANCRHVCVPRSGSAADSVALRIAQNYLRPDAVVHEQSFPMTADPDVLRRHWREAAHEVHAILARGEDCCFLTLGDALLYSTYIYLLRELQAIDPAVRVVTVPGVTAFSAAAALTGFPVGEGQQFVTIVPASDQLDQFTAALDRGGTVVLMKIGQRLQRVLDELDARGLLDQAVFVSHAGMAQQQVETDLRRLRGQSPETGYLSVLIVRADRPAAGDCPDFRVSENGTVPFGPAKQEAKR